MIFYKSTNTKKQLLFYVLFYFCVFYTSNTFSNDIQVYNLSVIGQSTQDHSSLIQFSVSWDNSWRNDLAGAGYSEPYNWDAAWIFVKYRVNKGDWKHAYLDNNGSFAPLGSNLDIGLLTPSQPFNITSNPGLGAFIYRSENGIGSNDFQNIKLKWNYGANGVGDNDLVDLKVFALEMVNIPQDSFHLGGSGSLIRGNFYTYPNQTTSYYVTSEEEIKVDITNGSLYYNLYGSSGDQLGPIPQPFPKGYNQIYSMKYELSQQGYVDFLNTLNREQQRKRIYTSIYSFTTRVTKRYVMTGSTSVEGRNGIACDSIIQTDVPITFYCDLNGNYVGSEYNDGHDIACNNLGWADISAYLDWSGLRPISELEFEKVCRGPHTAALNEAAWGNDSVTQTTGILNHGQDSEISTNNGNCTYDENLGIGPLRIGSFATNSSNRISSGASYYGVMEMSGNMYEHAITVGNPQGRAYTGLHGNGELDSLGNHDVYGWPALDAVGDGRRGGNWFTYFNNILVSYRANAAVINAGRKKIYGIRGVRSTH